MAAAKPAAVRRAEELVEREMSGRDASHDAAHTFRVRDLALSLARRAGPLFPRPPPHRNRLLTSLLLCSTPSSTCYAESQFSLTSVGFELLQVELAALLHDIGDYKYTKDNAEDMSIVERFLEDVGLEECQRDEIVAIIKGMGFKNEISKKLCVEPTLEFSIVQDADRLDAIGIARCFTYGGSKNNTLHDPKILPRDNLSKEKYMCKDEKQTSIVCFCYERVVKIYNESIKTLDDSGLFSKASFNLHMSYFNEALGLIEEVLPQARASSGDGASTEHGPALRRTGRAEAGRRSRGGEAEPEEAEAGRRSRGPEAAVGRRRRGRGGPRTGVGRCGRGQALDGVAEAEEGWLSADDWWRAWGQSRGPWRKRRAPEWRKRRPVSSGSPGGSRPPPLGRLRPGGWIVAARALVVFKMMKIRTMELRLLRIWL